VAQSGRRGEIAANTQLTPTYTYTYAHTHTHTHTCTSTCQLTHTFSHTCIHVILEVARTREGTFGETAINRVSVVEANRAVAMW
jgi:hypothetical protein